MPGSWKSLMIAAGFVVCWSSGFVGGQLATNAATEPMTLFAWRFAIAAAMAGAFWLVVSPGRVSGTVFLSEMTVGSLTVGGYLLPLLAAISLGVSPGVAALIGAMQPLLAVLLAARYLGDSGAPGQWLGMALATLGVVLCIGDDISGGAAPPFWAYGLPVLSVASVSAGSVLAARLPQSPRLAPALTAQLTAATVVFLAAGLVEGGGRVQLPIWEADTGLALVWLVLLSTFGGYGFFVASLRSLGVRQTSMLVYLTPPVTLVWALAMFGDRPGAAGYAGMAIAVTGVMLTLRRQPSPTPSGGPEAEEPGGQQDACRGQAQGQADPETRRAQPYAQNVREGHQVTKGQAYSPE